MPREIDVVFSCPENHKDKPTKLLVCELAVSRDAAHAKSDDEDQKRRRSVTAV